MVAVGGGGVCEYDTWLVVGGAIGIDDLGLSL
jgi:hypothetical protein